MAGKSELEQRIAELEAKLYAKDVELEMEKKNRPSLTEISHARQVLEFNQHRNEVRAKLMATTKKTRAINQRTGKEEFWCHYNVGDQAAYYGDTYVEAGGIIKVPHDFPPSVHWLAIDRNNQLLGTPVEEEVVENGEEIVEDVPATTKGRVADQQ